MARVSAWRPDGIGPGAGDLVAGGLQPPPHPAGPELRRDLRAASPRPRRTARSGRGRPRARSSPGGPAAASRSTRARASHSAWWANASTSKSARELPVEHAQDVAVELGRDALRVVVGRPPSPARRSTRLGAQQQPLPRPQHRRAAWSRNAARSAGSRLPMVPPRNATMRRPPRGQPVEVPGEVADHAVQREPRVVGGERVHRLPAAPTRSRPAARTWRRSPARRNASSSSRVFTDEPEPSSTSVSAPDARRSRRRRPPAAPARCGSGSTRAAG